MYASAAKLVSTLLLTSKLFSFNFVIHFTSIMCNTSLSVIPFDFLLCYYDYLLASDLENLFSNAHSHDK